MSGSWDAMLRWEAENGIQRPAMVPEIRPAVDEVVEQRPAEPARISSTAGLAALRAGARRAGLLYGAAQERENGCACEVVGELPGCTHGITTNRENGSAEQ